MQKINIVEELKQVNAEFPHRYTEDQFKVLLRIYESVADESARNSHIYMQWREEQAKWWAERAKYSV